MSLAIKENKLEQKRRQQGGSTYLSMAMVSLWGNMCTMSALRVSRLVSSWVRCTLRVSSPSWRKRIPAFVEREDGMAS